MENHLRSAPFPSNISQDVLNQMPDHPRPTTHRRSRSEVLRLPDDVSFDSDLGVVGAGTDEDDVLAMYIDMERLEEGEGSGGRRGHQRCQSMDGGGSVKVESGGGEGERGVGDKKVMSAAKLADLALVDPKRAKRIWANRQSAARSKERKMRYISELERKVQTLQTEATTLLAQLTMLQRDTTGLTSENSELKLRLQTTEQQVHLQDALNDALREEVQRLKLMTGQGIPNGAQMMNYGSSSLVQNQQYYSQNHNMQSVLPTHQLQQLILHHSQQQLHPNQLQLPSSMPPEMKTRGPISSQNQNR